MDRDHLDPLVIRRRRPELGLFGPEVCLVLAAQGLIFWITGLYKGLWRFASLPDLWNILRAATLGALAISVTLFLYNRLATVPRTVLLVYPRPSPCCSVLPRLAYRYWKDNRLDFLSRSPAHARARARRRTCRRHRWCAVWSAKTAIDWSACSMTIRRFAARASTVFRCSARSNNCPTWRARPPRRCC